MVTWRRRLAELPERASRGRLVRAAELPRLFEHRFLQRFLHDFQVDVVFDVGANIGQYGTMLRRRVGFTGHIISFEPTPRIAEQLQRAAAADPKWHVEQLALSDVAGSARFNVMKGHQFSSLLAPSTREVAFLADQNAVEEVVEVTTSTFDDVFSEYRQRLGFQRPFLKMDTQGHDLQVFRGASATLHHLVGLQSELAFRRLYEGATGYGEAIEAYQAAGFVLSSIFPNNAGTFPDLLEMDCVLYRSELRPGSV